MSVALRRNSSSQEIGFLSAEGMFATREAWNRSGAVLVGWGRSWECPSAVLLDSRLWKHAGGRARSLHRGVDG